MLGWRADLFSESTSSDVRRLRSPAETVLTAPAHPYTKTLLAAVPRIGAARPHGGGGGRSEAL